MADDVRVRLSAEGVQEVVDAIKRIRDEAKHTGEEGSKSFEAFKEAISEVGKELLGFVALEKIIEGTKELFKEVINGAASLEKLNRTTGLSTDALQAMGAAAKETNVDQQTLNSGLEIFTRNVGLAENGSRKAAQGFSELGIRVADLKNLSPDEQFKLVAEKLSQVDDASRRAAIGSQLFGKQFLEIEPAIEEVSEQGFGKFLAKLQQLGVYLDQDTIRQMTAAKSAAEEIGEELKGLATEFLVGLMPAATKAMDEIVKDTEGDGVNAFKTLGEWVGKVVNLIVTGFRIAGATVGYVAAQIENAANHGKDALKDIGAGAANALKNSIPGGVLVPDFQAKTSKEYQASKDAMADEYGRQLAKIIDDYNKPPEAPKAPDEKKRDGIIPGVDQNAAAIARARLQFIEAQLQAELAVFNAQSKLREEADKQAYEEGKMSLEQYYGDRESILNTRYDKELNILKEKRAAIAALPVETNDNGTGEYAKRAQLAQIDGEIAAKQFEQQSSLATLKTEERQAQMQFYSDSLKAEQALYKLQGDKAAAAKLQLADELRVLDVQLRRAGISQADRDAALKTAADQGLAKINYDKTKADADATLQGLNTQIAEIQNKVKDGTLFPVQAEQRIIDLEKQRLPVLQQMAQQMQELAKHTGDATLQAQADQFAQKVRDIATATDLAGQQMAALKQTAQDALQNGLAGFLSSVATGTTSVSDAFRKMVYDIAGSLVQLEAKFLANQFIRWLQGQGQGSGAAGAQSTGTNAVGVLGRVGNFLGNLFGGGQGGGAAQSATTTANTTAVTANTAAQTAATSANAGILAALTANTAALTANTAAVSASASTSGGSGLLSSLGSGGGGGEGLAEGGHIRGPGTSTSDSIPAMLSDGEFVVNAGAVQQPGVLALLHAINGTPGYARGSAPGVRRYAEGGAVSGGGMTVQHYHVDASQIPQHIIQQHVANAVLDVIAKHPVKVRNSIG